MIWRPREGILEKVTLEELRSSSRQKISKWRGLKVETGRNTARRGRAEMSLERQAAACESLEGL